MVTKLGQVGWSLARGTPFVSAHGYNPYGHPILAVMSTTPYTREVLEVAAAADRPLDRFDIAEMIEPAPAGLEEESPEHEAWTERRIAIIGAAVELELQGLLTCAVPATGAEPDLIVISDAGRSRLAEL